METLKVKIKMPSELTLHIPTLSDPDLESIMRIISTRGVQSIQETISDMVIEEFAKKHEKLIGSAVRKLLDEKEEDIKKLIGLK